MMEGKEQALLRWMQAVTGQTISEITELRDGKTFELVLSKIEGFGDSNTPSESIDWKQNYNKLKTIYEQLNSCLRKNAKMALPDDLSYMNLIEMGQGKSEEGLQTLLHLVFIVCIQSSIKEEFIPAIMQLPSSSQKELMLIIQESTADREEEDERDNQITSLKQAVTKLEYAYNTVVTENDALRASLFEDEDRVIKNEELLRTLQRENQKLSRDLFDKNEMLIRSREELMLDKYGTVNEELVEDLKKELLEREQHYGQQIREFNQTVTNLKDELFYVKKTNTELIEEQSSHRNFMQGKMDHSNCIPIDKHKVKINQMLTLSKEVTQKEMTAKLENIKLKNVNAELEAKSKKANEELHKKKSDFMLNRNDAEKMKIEFFTRIRDSLKEKLDDFKPNKDPNSESCEEFLKSDA